MPVEPTRRDVLAGVAGAGALAAGASEAANAQAGEGPGEGWRNHRGSPARTAAAARSGPFPEPARQWDVTGLDDTVNTPRTPAVADGRLFATTEFGGYLYAFDAAGDLLWRERLPGDGDNRAPAVLGDSVLVQSGTTLRAFDVAGDGLAWERSAAVAEETVRSPGALPPTVHAGGVYALTTAAGLRAFDPSGGTRWELAPEEPRSLETAVAPAFGDDVAVLALDSGLILAVDLADGRRRWEVDAVENRADTEIWVAVPPVVVGGAAVVSTGDRLVALALENGSERWTYDLANRIETPLAAADGRLFVAETTTGFGATGESTLTALDAASGDVDWRRTVAGAGYAVGAPTVAGDDVLALVEDTLHALDAATGETRWRHATRDPWRPGEPAGGERLAVVGDRVAVMTERGVYVLGPDGGVGNVAGLLAGVAGGGLLAAALASAATGTSPAADGGGVR